MSRIKAALLSGGVGVIAIAIVDVLSILRSTSSTAAVGFIFLPFFVAPYFIPFFVFGYCLPDLCSWRIAASSDLAPWAKLRAAAAAVLLAGTSAYVLHGVLLTKTVTRMRTMDAAGLATSLHESPFRKNKFALGALAENPNATGAILDEVAKLPDPALHRRMWSVWPVMGKNGKGLAVMRLVARNPNVSPETLVLLSQSSDEYVRGDVALNPKTPTAIIRKLSDGADYLVQWDLAANPKTPADILVNIAASDNEYTRSHVARNPNTPASTLQKLARDPVWHVRRDVASNPHTPPATIRKLASDPDERVKSTAERRVNRAASNR
jgi:hypothetical protein